MANKRPGKVRRYNLKMMRLHALPQDLADEALSPGPEAVAMPSPSSGYTKVNLYATTLDELYENCQPYGDAAVARCQWSAIAVWLMKGDAVLSHAYSTVLNAVLIIRDHDHFTLGYPNHDGKSQPSKLKDLSPDEQCQTIKVAMDTYDDWQREGSPLLSAARCQATKRHLKSSLLAIADLNTQETNV